MAGTRRAAILSLFASAALTGAPQQDQDQGPPRRSPIPEKPNEDPRLPNGKSQKDAIAKQDHEAALKDAEDLVAAAEQLRDEIKQAGNYVVPLSSVKKTEEIEKLARKIRGRLKD